VQVRLGEVSTESWSREQVFCNEKLVRGQVQSGVHSSGSGEPLSGGRGWRASGGDVWSDSSLEDE